MNKDALIGQINKLKKEKKAVILAHNYQVPEVQDIADFVGDSLMLSKLAVEVESDFIVFCGVEFMAESAKILSPNKRVFLPAKDAGCPMADMVTREALREYKQKNPERKIVCYVNSSAEVKAEADVCCTSSNALNIIKKSNYEKMMFVPDQNLGSYIKNQMKKIDMELWKGFCITHHRVLKEDIEKVKKANPEALVLVHPECQEEVVELADFVGSTSQIIDFAGESDVNKFIIVTERGVLHKLQNDNPKKEFILATEDLTCYNMKKTGLEDVLKVLETEKNEIFVEEEIRLEAIKSLDNMLKLS